MKTRRLLSALIGCTLMAWSAAAPAAETTADWIKRILDPKTIDVEPFPGSTLNRKITVDTIRFDDPSKRIAVYMIPIDKLKEAVDYFSKAFGIEPMMPGKDNKGFERYVFQLDGEGKYPPKAKGLQVIVIRSPWVEGMAQIQMVFTPPK